MVNLVIDIGNTYSKIALFNNRDLLKLEVSEGLDINRLEHFFMESPIENAIVASVGVNTEELETFLAQRCRYLQFSTGMPAGVRNHYKSPQTLGPDRYAAVIAAKALFNENDCLVIDAGTCVTYDFVDKQGNYYGGSISPGINMRFRAMNTFTARLPLIEADMSFEGVYGADTREAMLSGVINGLYYEIVGFIEQYYKKFPDLKVLVCGGDIAFFDRVLKNSIFAEILHAEPNLVLIGLNEVIHQYND